MSALSALARRAAAVGLLLAAALWPPAQAGQACEAAAASVDSVRQGLALAEATAAALDASGAQVLLLGRAGQDLRAHGLRWSHLGLAYRDGDRWRVLHKLNHCGAGDAALYRQGLAQFFFDQPWRYEAVAQPLAPALQAALLPLLHDDARASTLDEPRYSLVAYPWAQTYQQSNQWLIETLALAAEPAVHNRLQAQAWLRLTDYRPTVLALGPLTRLGARLSRANVAFDDHPNDQRFADRIATVTAESVLDWVQRAGLADGVPFIVR